MDEDVNKIIAEQMKILPKDVRDAIISVDYKTKLQEITKRQKLLIDQAAKLEMETTLVMIGLEPLPDYINNLQRELEMPIIRAKEIALDVSENIFKPIRTSLHAMNEGVESEEDIQTMTETIAAENRRLAEPRSTDSNDANLNRDQILNEIENPSTIGKSNSVSGFKVESPVSQNQVAINPQRAVETLAEVPYQQDVKIKKVEGLEKEVITPRPTVLETKMAGITITSQQIINAKPESKLPEIEKKRPTGGADPYRESVN